MDPRFRILMVDDVTRYQMLYEMAITEALPASVSFATNGEEALDKLASSIVYDLLILDLNMPKLGGEETLARIRQDPNFDTMPVVILTGDSDQEKHRRLLELGADDFIEKGSPPEIFVARLKAQLRHKLALDQLSRIAVDMDIFAAGVLHDIRNLETSILAVCELAREYLNDDPLEHQELVLQDLATLEERADQLERYASEIIAMVRETQKPIKLAAQELSSLVHWAAKIAADRSSEEDQLSYEIVGTLQAVVADQHFLQLALLNIFQNAVKYRRAEAKPHMTISQRSSSAKGQFKKTLITCFRDNGRGIKQRDLRRIFEPFVRGSDQRKDGGFGLGLSLVAKVISSMSGKVWAEIPTEGAGTTMCIELPLATPAEQ